MTTQRKAPTCARCGVAEFAHTWCAQACRAHPKHTILATTRNGGTIRGQRTPTGAVDYDAGIYYTQPKESQ